MFFRLMRETGAYIDVTHKGHLLRVHVEDLGEMRKPARRKKKKPDIKIQSEKCPDCNKLMIEGVCMNALCPSRSR